jgi:nicotinamide phosphoribosyltransferase
MTVFNANPLLATDSYKASHWLQYPPGATRQFSYIESRGGASPWVMFFGLQALLTGALSKRITRGNIDEAIAVFAAHGLPFNATGFRRIVSRHSGRLPLLIRALPEGTRVPVGVPMVTVVNTDPTMPWLTSYVETMLLRAVWYPSTVATTSAHLRGLIGGHLARTCDIPDAILPSRLHDFGARGVSSAESAALGGLAHLVSFAGTDTVEALILAQRVYDCPMAGYSIPAAEHSTITSWGRAHEADAYRAMLTYFAKPGSFVAVVSDSYDIYHAARTIWGAELRDEVLASGATVIIRPDSGDPLRVPIEVVDILAGRFGTTVNAKGYKVLNAVRVIQGDGIDPGVIAALLEALTAKGYSAENIAFGMGGALLQKVNRDTHKFAMKCSAMEINGRWADVSKSPVTDPGKASKAGRLDTIATPAGGLETVRLPDGVNAHAQSAMIDVYRDGTVRKRWTLDDIRAHARIAFPPAPVRSSNPGASRKRGPKKP